MATRVCNHGHRFEKTSDCPVCPICSAHEMKNAYGDAIPPIGAPAFRALDSIGISKLADLTKYTEKELLALHGFGPRALSILQDALDKKGLSFSTS